MLIRKDYRKDHHPCLTYFQSVHHADLNYEKMIINLSSLIGDNSSLSNLNIREDENIHYCVVIIIDT
ncbi:unnamed protein product [Hymenolepis diminuta]|uniref:Uncharacterized protein n=1 Tax=Hymenolepis diminuta TaxID=6216 RepID=A0A564Z5Q0_HYMDI|nr:unnamed protein product [Hymenolepis diminuta]